MELGGEDQTGAATSMSASEATSPPIVGLILAGGRGTRMGGGDKPLLTIAGRPMLSYVIERFAPQVAALAISANGDPARFADFGLPVVTDTIEGYAGPLAGILAGMRWAKDAAPGARFIASAAADTPFFPADLVARLSEGCGSDQQAIALAASGAGTHPTFGLWPTKLVDDLEAFIRGGGRKVMAFADLHLRLNVAFDDLTLPGGETIDPFFNVNTPEDAARAEKLTAILATPG